MHGTLDFHKITDGIVVGTNACCQTHFEEKLRDELGIEADISLEGERIDAALGVQYYLWLPVEDRHAPTLEQLELGVVMLEKLVAMRKKVYVHCKNGHGRAPTLVAAYLVRKGKSVSDAIEFLRERRPSVHIEDAQRKALEAFAHRSWGHEGR